MKKQQKLKQVNKGDTSYLYLTDDSSEAQPILYDNEIEEVGNEHEVIQAEQLAPEGHNGH